jgi:hypothetical protein
MLNYTRLGHELGILAARFFVLLRCGDRNKPGKVGEVEQSDRAKKMRMKIPRAWPSLVYLFLVKEK